jgi:hypothetical protein
MSFDDSGEENNSFRPCPCCAATGHVPSPWLEEIIREAKAEALDRAGEHAEKQIPVAANAGREYAYSVMRNWCRNVAANLRGGS